MSQSSRLEGELGPLRSFLSELSTSSDFFARLKSPLFVSIRPPDPLVCPRHSVSRLGITATSLALATVPLSLLVKSGRSGRLASLTRSNLAR